MLTDLVRVNWDADVEVPLKLAVPLELKLTHVLGAKASVKPVNTWVLNGGAA